MFFFFKQKTAYEMRISDWSSDVCSSDLHVHGPGIPRGQGPGHRARQQVAAGRLGREAEGRRKAHHRVQALVQADQRALPRGFLAEIGRASCRERECQYVTISVVAV